MPRLHQVVAIETGEKAKVYRTMTDIYKRIQKVNLFTGFSKTFQPRDEEGDMLPAESSRVQMTVPDQLRELAQAVAPLMDITLTKDFGNLSATATLHVGDQTLPEIPVTTLLAWEKLLADLRTELGKLPLLDPAEEWRWDSVSGLYASAAVETTRNKKVPRTLVKYEATEKHPAQVEVWYEDIPVGVWNNVKFSGAMPRDKWVELMGRIDSLIVAVKFAREEANSITVNNRVAGKVVFDYLFGPLTGPLK